MITHDMNPIPWKMRLESVSTNRQEVHRPYDVSSPLRVNVRRMTALAMFAFPLILAGLRIFEA